MGRFSFDHRLMSGQRRAWGWILAASFTVACGDSAGDGDSSGDDPGTSSGASPASTANVGSSTDGSSGTGGEANGNGGAGGTVSHGSSGAGGHAHGSGGAGGDGGHVHGSGGAGGDGGRMHGSGGAGGGGGHMHGTGGAGSGGETSGSGGHHHGAGGWSGTGGADEDEALPIWWAPYEPVAATVDAGTTNVAVLPRPEHIDVPPKTACPHLRGDLVPFDPAWLLDGVVAIPGGTSVLLDGNDDISATTLVRQLIVPEDSELVLADRDATFRVTDVTVAGALRLGSPTCRLDSHIEIVFDTDEDVDDPGVRADIHGRAGLGIVVEPGGRLDIFGRLYQPTWTRLSATASASSTTIALAEMVDWEVGQQVLVTTSSALDYPTLDQNEVRTITGVNGSQLTLDTPLVFGHFGGAAYQVEVGLLSRSIVLRTDDALLAGGGSFGGHVMAHVGRTRVSGAELYGMGQRNFIGRYPFHFHWAGDLDRKSYFTDNSIWRSNWRCAVVHRTDRAVVSRNVAYDVYGHCFYIEDGVEEDNEISFNLAARVKYLGPGEYGAQGLQDGVQALASSELVNPADIAASGFYVTNGNNHILGNAASSGFAGYTFPYLPEPIGTNPDGVQPLAVPISHFDGNSVRSSSYLWRNAGGVYIGGVLETVVDQGVEKLRYTSGRPSGQFNRTSTDVISNLQASLVSGAITHWGSFVRTVNVQAADSGVLATLFGKASIEGAVFTGRTPNFTPALAGSPVWQMQHIGYGRGFQFYDTATQTILDSVVFRDMQPLGCALTSMTHSDQYTPQRMNATARLFFTNTDDSTRFCNRDDQSGTLSSRNFNWNDEDGSGTRFAGDGLAAGPRIIGSGYLDTWDMNPGCIRRDDWDLWICPRTGTQNIASVAVLPSAGVRATMYGLDNTPLGETFYSGTNFADDNNVQISGPSEVGWHHRFPNGVPASFFVHSKQVPEDSFVLMSFTLPPGVSCSIADAGWTAVADLDSLLASTSYVYTTAQSTCFVRLPPTSEMGDFEAAGLRVPNQTWRDWPEISGFTVTTGCTNANPACANVVSVVPTMP